MVDFSLLAPAGFRDELDKVIPLPHPYAVGFPHHLVHNDASQGLDARVPTLDLVYFAPFPVVSALTLTEIRFRVLTAGSGGAVVRVGICEMGALGTPSDLVVDLGTVGVETDGNKDIVANQALSPGGYYVMLVTQVAVGTLELGMFRDPAFWGGIPMANESSGAAGGRQYGLSGSTVSGAFPADLSGLTFALARDVPTVRITVQEPS